MKLNAFNQGLLHLRLPLKLPLVITSSFSARSYNTTGSQLLRVMKLTIVIMTLFLAQLSAATFAQRLTYKKQGATLKQVFTQVRMQTGYNVLYSEQTLNVNQKIDVDFNNTDLTEVFAKVIGDKLAYSIENKNILIKERTSSILDKANVILNSVQNLFENIDVSGRVIDAEGNPLAGATVKIKGSNRSIVTSSKGSFSLNKVDEKAVLVISYIGYISQEIKAKANLGDVILVAGSSGLDELQVIAYGSVSKRFQTGNVTTIKAADIEKQPVNNILMALQGRVPGLVITPNSGVAGAGITVRLQGTNSIGSGNDPFYVIDGIPYASQMMTTGLNGFQLASSYSGSPDGTATGNPLNFLNPADIESVDVLKDADATAIYGSRAANGAILITTKKGKAGPTRVAANIQNGWGEIPKFQKLMNTTQYLAMRREAMRYSGTVPTAANAYDILGLYGYDTTRTTDWQRKLMGGKAQYTDISLNVSGGDVNTQFMVGVGYHRETSVAPTANPYTKPSVMFNLSTKSTNKKFRMDLRGNYVAVDNVITGGNSGSTTSNGSWLYNIAATLPPDAPDLYNADGSVNWAPDATGTTTWGTYSPIQQLLFKSRNKTNNLMGSANIGYKLLDGLEISTALGYYNLTSIENQLNPSAAYAPEVRATVGRQAQYANNYMNSWNIDPQLTYEKKMGRSNLKILLGGSLQQSSRDGQKLTATGFTSDAQMDNIAAATTITPGLTENSLYKYNAYFGRINYIYEDKYLLNLTARRDGSSRFQPANRFNNFGSLAAGWIFSEESLIKEALPFLSFGKLTASYGTTGNDQIPDYQYLSLYNVVTYGVAYQGGVAYAVKALTNSDLQWESTKKAGVGLDLNFLKDRLMFTTRYTRARSSDQLTPYKLPSTAGLLTVNVNFPAVVQNATWEFTLTAIPVKAKDLEWTISANLGSTANKLVAFPDLANSSYASTLIIGQPLSVLQLYHYLGVDPATGTNILSDANGNPTSVPNATTDRTVFLTKDPKYTGGIQNTLRYKRFTFDAMFTFRKSIAVYDRGAAGSLRTNAPAALIDQAWHNPGDIAATAPFTSTFNVSITSSDAYYADASYIRLQNASLYWQLPDKWAKATGLQTGSLFAQGQNLFTLTKYPGLDPESLNRMPSLRVITFGIKLGL